VECALHGSTESLPLPVGSGRCPRMKSSVATSTWHRAHQGGEIRSLDGDRAMGIFVGDRNNTHAVTAATPISWAVTQAIQPRLDVKRSDLNWKMT